jgi:hypothetical protein
MKAQYTQNSSASSYHQQPDEAFFNITPSTPAAFVTTTPDVSDILADEQPMTKRRGRPFAKGYDSTRHVFSQSECQLGFQRAIESIVSRYPNAVDKNNVHMVTRFLPSISERRAA